MAKLIAPRRGEFLTPDGNPTPRFIQYLESLTGSTNTSNEDIITIFDRLTGFNEFDELFEADAVEQIKDDVVITSVNYTTIGNQSVVCTGKITVTLNAEPEDQELVKVLATTFRVDIDGNGNAINGETDAIIRRNFTTWDIIYLVEIDGWRII